MTRVYKIKAIIDGYHIGISGGDFVAVPKERLTEDLIVRYGEEEMEIKKDTRPITEKTFADKFGRDKLYTLCYFTWKPDKSKTSWSMDGRIKLLEAWKAIKK